MSGNSVLKDGNLLLECYGSDLDKLNVADRIGVMRTSSDELKFFINGESQGEAATGMPKTIYAVVNLYGKCVQVSVHPSDSLVRQLYYNCLFSNILKQYKSFVLKIKMEKSRTNRRIDVLLLRSFRN